MGNYHEEQYEIIHYDSNTVFLRIHRLDDIITNEDNEEEATYVQTNETFAAKPYQILSFEDQGYMIQDGRYSEWTQSKHS